MIGRWASVDLLAEAYEHLTPYNYGMNNPILMIDIGGMASDSTNKPKPPPTAATIGVLGITLQEVVVTSTRITKPIPVLGQIVTAGYTGWSIGWGISSNIKDFSRSTADFLIMLGVSRDLLYGPAILQSRSKDAKDLELPTIDNTGKVHGELPDPNDMKKFPKDKLKQFLRDLIKSVQQRQKFNSRLGPDPGHATRLQEEHELIKVISKILN